MHIRFGASRNICAVLALAAVLAACQDQKPAVTHEPPPAGTPDTPYWYTLRDSLFWYLPADSHAVVQMTSESTPNERSEALIAVRKLGWRMSVQRSGASLSRGKEAQDLSQFMFAVDRVDEAANLMDHLDTFRETFWSGPDTTLLGLLPGLRLRGEGLPQYFWPCVLAVVWRPGMHEPDARAVIDSLGFTVYDPMALTHSYWVERSWTIRLPAGVELFTWLRWFNRDPRVHLAHPILANRDVPYGDFRLVQRFPLEPDSLIPPGVEKFSAMLKTCWEIATFCGNTSFIEDEMGVGALEGKLHVILNWSGGGDPAAAITAAGGEVVSSKSGSTNAWVPYDQLAVIAAAPGITRAEEVRANLLGN